MFRPDPVRIYSLECGINVLYAAGSSRAEAVVVAEGLLIADARGVSRTAAPG